MNSFENTASSKEVFELMYSRLEGINSNFLNTVLKATAAFLLVTGWLITSQTANNHLQNDQLFKWLIITGLTVYGLLFSFAAYTAASSAKKALKQLEELKYIDTVYLLDLVVSEKTAVIFSLANWMLVGAVITYVVRLSS